MSTLRFTPEHEWLRTEADGSVTVGITPFAQEALGDVVFVQLPELAEFARHAEVSVLESVKAASSIHMPIAGQILEINTLLEESPETVNADPLGAGWFFRFMPAQPDEVATLLDQHAYENLISAQG